MDKSKVDAARELFSENSYWKDIYDKAPSEACKERIALNFYYSTFFDEANADDTFAEEVEKVESKLDLEDWKYLLKYQGNNPGVVKIKQKIAELSQK